MRTKLFFLVCGLALMAGAGWAAPLGVYVSPAGSDAWSGRLPAPNAGKTDGPFATLQRAQAEVRRLKAEGKTGPGVTISVRAGTYRLSEALALGPEDSGTEAGPVVWRAHAGERVTLTGSVPVTGFQTWKGQIAVADLRGTPLEKVAFRQIFFRGERQVMARYPNVDAQDPHFGQWAYVRHADPAPATRRSPSDVMPQVKDHFTATADIIKPAWRNIERAEVCIHPAYGWAWNVVPIKAADDETDVLTLARNVGYGLMIGDRYFVQNLLTELDAPGEWYLDRDEAHLYFWPPAELKAGEVSAPVAASLVTMKGAEYVTFRGFTLENCDGTAVQITDCRHCRVAAGTLRNTGAWAVAINGGHHSGAVGNDITATGAGGISLNGGDRKTLRRGDNYATNNYIHHIAAFQRTYNTGVNVSGVGNLCNHNLIHDCYHQAILMGGNDNTVEYNVVHHTNLGSEDTGCFYMSSRDWTMRGNVIRHNLFHHPGGFGKSNSWRPVKDGQVEYHYPGFTWGIYLDAPESGCMVYGNILYGIQTTGMFNHSGRDNVWENNILVDGPAFQASAWGEKDLFDTSWQQFKAFQVDGTLPRYLEHYPELAGYREGTPRFNTMYNCRFVRNIVYYSSAGNDRRRENQAAWGGGQLLYSWRGHKDDLPEFTFDYNCVYAPPGVDPKVSLAAQPEPTRLLGWEEWRKLGKDEHSLLADPLFRDAEKHDYRLKANSPALKLGFKPIPVEKIGPYQDELRATWPVVEAPGAAARGEFTTRRYFKVPGHEPLPASEVQPRGGLANVAAKLKAGQPVTVVAFAGGSHAQGGWTDQVGEWLRQRYPAAKVNVINASICGCVRGSGFSAFRLGHDVLRHQPDLVVVDFAADDFESDADSVMANAEGIVRQTWKAHPGTDLLFAYAFRVGYEADYEKGLCPGAVTAYERVANHYGIPALNMGCRVAQMAREGKMLLKTTPEQAKQTPATPVFTTDGTYASPAAARVYATTLQEGLARLLDVGTPAPHTLRPALRAGHMEGAVQVPITREMLSGEWQESVPAVVDGKSFAGHFDRLWVTKQPGAKLTFRFSGTRAWVFDVFGPGTGRVRVTVDGEERGIRQQVDAWSHYYRLGGLEIAQGLAPGEHTAVLELLPDPPDRAVPMEAAKKANQYRPEAFTGVAMHLGALCVLGE